VLALLAPGEPLTVGQLHQGLGHRRSTLTGILDRLEGAALVQRRANPADRRSSVVVLTASGRAAARRAVAALQEIDGLIAGAVTAPERRGFVAVADALATALEPGAGG
jgi:DNA-binding MarR family transcriptional regulator